MKFLGMLVVLAVVAVFVCIVGIAVSSGASIVITALVGVIAAVVLGLPAGMLVWFIWTEERYD